IAGNLEPGLGGDVFGVGADEGLQIAQEQRLQCAVEMPERFFVALLCGGYRRSQGGLLGGRRVTNHGTCHAHTVMLSSVWAHPRHKPRHRVQRRAATKRYRRQWRRAAYGICRTSTSMSWSKRAANRLPSSIASALERRSTIAYPPITSLASVNGPSMTSRR